MSTTSLETAVFPSCRKGVTLVLASRSPQRTAILRQLGIPHEVDPADAQELTAGPPQDVALENAWRKAAPVARRRPHDTVLGVDTVVALGARIHPKPADEGAARATLEALSGRRH